MYEFQFGKNNNEAAYECISATKSRYPLLMPAMWGEHCIECAAPHCYATCLRFQARRDAHCRRFVSGIEAVEHHGALAARVNFKAWSKLECAVTPFFIPAEEYERIYRQSLVWGRTLAGIAAVMPGGKLKSKTTGAWNKLVSSLINRAAGKVSVTGPVQLKLAFHNEDKPTSLLVDCKKEDGGLASREIIAVPMGDSSFCLELDTMNGTMWVNLHPADVEDSVELLITEAVLVPQESKAGSSEKKVKCVIWDMDNTLWNGVLIENENVAPKPELVALIKRLDAMGIVNSIASKNNHEQVMNVLKQHGIDDLFVFPKINWDPKSANIAKTVKDMNINANTVVFVDDNPFEREEVKEMLPAMTCVDPADIESLAQGERFRVAVSAESAQRRQTYKMLEALKNEEEHWQGNIDTFLLNCRIALTLKRPQEDSIPRCYELLQRSNQLNASGRRLSMEELTALVHSPTDDCYVLESSDKFGAYGIVGVAIVNKSAVPRMTDFVISCRVANKKIEPTLVNYLAHKYGDVLRMDFLGTKLNGPMKRMITELGMKCLSKEGENEVYEHSYDKDFPKIVNVTDCTDQ